MCIVCNSGIAAFLKGSASRRDFLKYAGAASAFIASGVDPNPVRARPLDGPADVIFRGGPILTMSEAMPRAEALAIRGERILATGRMQDVEARRGPAHASSIWTDEPCFPA